MITKFTLRNNSTFLYLTQGMIQLLHIVPENTYFVFTLKNKKLYISSADSKSSDSPFVSKLRKTGSGWGIYMSKSLLEFIEVNPENDKIEVNIEEETLILNKAKK